MRKSFLALAFLAFCPLLVAQQSMDNVSVIKLVKAGLSDDLIVSTINGSPGAYDTSAEGLIALKKAGASDKVVSAIVMKASAAAPPPSSPRLPSADPQAPPSPADSAAPPPFRSTDGKARIYVTDHPISEFNSISKGFSSASHSQSGDDPRTVEIQADIVKLCPAYVIASNNPNRADYVLVFRSAGW